MFASIKSRLWLGYLLLSVVIISATVFGLAIALARSPLLYRAKLLALRTNESQLVEAIANVQNPSDIVKIIQNSSTELKSQKSTRVIILDESGKTLYDSYSAFRKPILWRNVQTIQDTQELGSFNFIRDTRGVAWIYVGQHLQSSGYLVVADLKGNPSITLLLSDPMTRTVFRVFLLAIILSLLLTILLSRWVSRPIAQIVENAKRMASGKLLPLTIDGPQEVQELAAALNEMSSKVSESQQAQRDFVFDVSHELKTPLTSITGFAGAILDGTVSSTEEVNHAAEVIQNEAGRMYRLVTDLLLLARVEGGADQLKFERVQPGIVLQNIIDRFAMTAGAAQIKLVNSSGDLPACLTDVDRVTQILNNLLDNAIKFSAPNSTVELSASFDEKWLKIMVADHGIGIAPEDQKKIFDRFFQVDRSRSKTGYSSGLGLPIARQIAQNLGGDLTIKSEPGIGSTFTLSLPIQPNISQTLSGKSN
ncbi:MAG: sensor histidine kinase [Anaerolineaceae bacterium]